MSIKKYFLLIISVLSSSLAIQNNASGRSDVRFTSFSAGAANKEEKVVNVPAKNEGETLTSMSATQRATPSPYFDRLAAKNSKILNYENTQGTFRKTSPKMQNNDIETPLKRNNSKMRIEKEFPDSFHRVWSAKKSKSRPNSSSKLHGDHNKPSISSQIEDLPSVLRDETSPTIETSASTTRSKDAAFAIDETSKSSVKDAELSTNPQMDSPVVEVGAKSASSEDEEATQIRSAFKLAASSTSRHSYPRPPSRPSSTSLPSRLTFPIHPDPSNFLSSPSSLRFSSGPSSPSNLMPQLVPPRLQRLLRTSGLGNFATERPMTDALQRWRQETRPVTSARPLTGPQAAAPPTNNSQDPVDGSVVSYEISVKKDPTVALKYTSSEVLERKMKSVTTHDSHQSTNDFGKVRSAYDEQNKVDYSNRNLPTLPELSYYPSSPGHAHRNDQEAKNEKVEAHRKRKSDLIYTSRNVVAETHTEATPPTGLVISQENNEPHPAEGGMQQQSLRVQEETRRLLDAAAFATTPQHRSAGPERDYVEVGAAAQPVSRKIALYVYTSKNGVVVAVDGEEVYRSWNQTSRWSARTVRRLHAGVHVLVLHARTGHVMRTAKFTTWEPASAAQLVTELRAVNEGRVLVLVGAPDFVKDLTEVAEDLVSSLGSQFFQSLVLYESLVFVVRTGGPVLYEAARTKYEQLSTAKLARGYEWDGPPLVVDALIDVIETPRCPSTSVLSSDHAQFCETHAGFGDFCACSASLASVVPPPLPVNRSLPVIAVALVGGLRLPQVLDQVRVIRSHPAGQHVPLILCLDGPRPAAQHLAQLLNISVAIADNAAVKRGTLSRINIMIQFALTVVFRQFELAQFAVILEDDVQLSPDIMSYFQQTAPLLARKKEMLLCVNAYNTHSYPNTAYNLSRLIRHSGTFAYGWMITRAVGKELEEIDFWPAEYITSDWDFFYRGNVQGRRHILAPEVSRSHHQGAGGVHISGIEQERYYNARLFNSNVSYVKMDVESASRTRYIRFHLARVRRSVQLDLRKRHPCETGRLDHYPANASLVAFLDMPTEEDPFRAFEVTMKCLGSNDKGNQENLSMMYLIHPSRRPLYLVGCPDSYFCTQKQDASKWYRPTEDDVKFAETVHFARKPLLTKLSYRLHTADPSEEFTLNNGYEQSANVYVY